MKNSKPSQDAPDKRLTVLHVVLSLEIGGMENVIYDLVTGADQSRFRPMVLCLQSLGPFARELSEKGFPVFLAEPMRGLWSWVWPAPIIRCIRENRVDVVHVHTGCWFKAALAAKLCGKRLVLTEHLRYLPEQFARKYADILAGLMADRIAAVSREMGDYLRDTLHLPGSKISVVVNGVNVQRYAASRTPQPAGGVKLGIVARLQPVKDHATLLRALALHRREFPRTELFIAGDGAERPALEALARELGLDGAVRFLGPRRDIPDVLRGIDLFVLSSLSEGTPIALLEAMAAGKPVVSTAVGEIPNIVEEGKGGLLAPPASPPKLAQALGRLVADQDLRARMGDHNQRLVRERLSLQAMTRAYERLYVA